MRTMAFINYFETKARMLFQSRTSAKSEAPRLFVLSGQLLTENRLSLIRQSINAVSQLWVNKANAYIGQLCLDFGFSPRELARYLASILPALGYTTKEQDMLLLWMRGYETGIQMAIDRNKQ